MKAPPGGEIWNRTFAEILVPFYHQERDLESTQCNDGTLGMTYLRARWLDPYLNKFVSPDPIVPNYRNPQSVNRYAYALGNPINLTDPSGGIPSRPPIPRPPDVCGSPTESGMPPRSSIYRRPEYIIRHKDGSAVHWTQYLPSTDASMWWYCGEFKVSGYQFVDEVNPASGKDWYQAAGGTEVEVTTSGGVAFVADSEFLADVRLNGTGKPAAEILCPGNYFHYYNGMYYCGKGKQFDPNTDAYQVVAAKGLLRAGDEIYVPGLEVKGSTDPMDNGDFQVRDSGEGLLINQIDVFTGEGPGGRCYLGPDENCHNSSPTSLYTSYLANVRKIRWFADTDGVKKGGPMAVYQESDLPWETCLYESGFGYSYTNPGTVGP